MLKLFSILSRWLGAAALALGLSACLTADPAEKGKTVLICLDGGTWNSLTPLLQAGELPNLLQMMEEGAYGPLRADPPYSPPSWTSLATGLTPDSHGIHNFVRREVVDETSGRYELLPIRASDVAVPRLWDMVNANGLQVGVQRWLFTYPIQELDGVVVSDFKGVAADLLRQEPLQEDLRDNFQRRIFMSAGARVTRDATLAHDPQRSVEPFRERDAMLDKALRDIDAAEQAFAYVLEHYPEVDFHTVSFFWGNQMQHEYLHYWLAPTRYGASAEEAARYGQVVPDLYRLFDTFIADLRADPHIDRVMIVSDHGMELIPMELETNIGAYHFQIVWAELLADLGYADRVKPVAYRRTETGLELAAGVDAEALANDLESLRFADTNEPLFALVAPPAGQRWPHLVVGRYAPLRYADLPQLFDRPVQRGPEQVPAGRYLRFAGGFIRSEHGYDLNPEIPLGQEGIFLATGPGVKAGQRLDAGVARTIDITPTLLYLLGFPVAADMDGRVLTEIVAETLMRDRPMTTIPTYAGNPQRFLEAGGQDEEYDARTLERLRSLGYVN